MIDYRILHDPADLEEVVNLEVAVWGLNPRNAVPTAILHVMALGGGLILGAYDDARMVGLLICMVVKRGDDVFLWSHMTGTHPDYQNQGIGLALKRFQRRWALDNGYKSVRWTVDPLQRRNAWFNLHLLGEDAALSPVAYHVNFYGEMDDDINRGMPSDRIEVCWQLDEPTLHYALPGKPLLLLRADERGYPIKTETDWSQDWLTAAVPADLETLRKTDRDAVLAWRLALRETLMPALAHGYTAFDFTSNQGLYIYHLRRVE
ncbi:MAG: GNAT family N-acetyltransferase [Chloroflexi bacterium]|nr:GNAT family N-acetyltransferase [Chloroflexota bacterium]